MVNIYEHARGRSFSYRSSFDRPSVGRLGQLLGHEDIWRMKALQFTHSITGRPGGIIVIVNLETTVF